MVFTVVCELELLREKIKIVVNHFLRLHRLKIVVNHIQQVFRNW